jgi:uncharacterized protein
MTDGDRDAMLRSRMAWHKGIKRTGIGLLLVLLLGFVALNGLAYNHARAMLQYAPHGIRTDTPEALTFWSKARVLLTGVTLPRPADERTPASLAPDCEAVSIPVPGDITLSAWICDRGEEAPLVLLFHGYSTEKTGLLPEAKAFFTMGASVLLIDFRGSGGSSGFTTTLGVDEAEDVAAAVRYAQNHLPHSSLILFGQSMGSAAILRAVQEFNIAPDGVILQAVFDSMLQTIRNRFASMGVPSFPSAELLVFWGGQQMGFNGFAHNPVDYAASLRCPALFLHGADDPRATVAEGRRVFDAAPEPKLFLEFPDTGHDSYLRQHPDAWTEAVKPFFALLSRTPKTAAAD